MTPDVLEYLLRATTIWSLALLFYLVLRRSVTFGFGRFVLLAGWLGGLLIPLLPAGTTGRIVVATGMPTVTITRPITAVVPVEETIGASWAIADLLPWLYLAGVLLFGARALVRWWDVQRCTRGGKQTNYAGYPVITSGRVGTPFAARGKVFLPERLDAALTHTALIHETAHLRARHHYDKTLMTLTSVLLWFHPLTWVYRRLLANVHEYQADAAVLRSVPAKTYGRQLVRSALAPPSGLGLFSSPLKQRIAMLTQNPNRRFRLLPFLFFLLLMAGVTVACSDVSETIAPDEEVFTKVPVVHLEPTSEIEEYPRLLDGPTGKTAPENLIRAIYEEIRYPREARQMAYTGTVRATIVIDADGKFRDDLSIFRELSTDEPPAGDQQLVVVGYPTDDAELLPGNVRHSVLVDEVARTVRALGNFHPVKAAGKPTSVVLELDFTFNLEPAR